MKRSEDRDSLEKQFVSDPNPETKTLDIYVKTMFIVVFSGTLKMFDTSMHLVTFIADV
jgi:hypothetical protein